MSEEKVWYEGELTAVVERQRRIYVALDEMCEEVMRNLEFGKQFSLDVEALRAQLEALVWARAAAHAKLMEMRGMQIVDGGRDGA